MRRAPSLLLASILVLAAACGGQSSSNPATTSGSGGDDGAAGGAAPELPPPTLRADVTPVTSKSQAKPGVFIPPFLDCRDPLPGETGQGPDGKVCTHVAISACTEEGKSFADYAACDVVKTQRPFFAKPPAAMPSPDDPRLQDANFMNELAWVTKQVEACGCVCCHDSTRNGGKAGEWDISVGPIWTDTVSNSGLALFTGLADSSVLGAYPAADNHGFDRSKTGLPTTDTARLQAFFFAEMERRGFTKEEAAAVPPFGGPIYALQQEKPDECDPTVQGVDAQGRVNWSGGKARYVYVMEADSANPGVPPNLDLPQGTLWRLDVLASADGVDSGLRYGTTPEGSFQAHPETSTAPKLVTGKKYHLTTLWDVGLASTNCIFTYEGN